MTQAVKEGWENKSNNYDEMKLIVWEYGSKRECSEPEAVYYVMLELWLHKVFPAVLFASTDLPSFRTGVLFVLAWVAWVACLPG